jgi:anthranilate synthase/aminodeoxychorismate synthase-like glutamine amidotransferase
MKIVIIDNYDSFTYNLFQYFKHFKNDVIVVKNNEVDCDSDIIKFADKLVFSPGPGKPNESGNTFSILDNYKASKSILGVCLGHQIIAEYFGAKIEQLENPLHGKAKQIIHNGQIYTRLKQNTVVGLYHSLFVSKLNFPNDLIIESETESGIIMGICHKKYDLVGVQFHPESILTENGLEMIKNWISN